MQSAEFRQSSRRRLADGGVGAVGQAVACRGLAKRLLQAHRPEVPVPGNSAPKPLSLPSRLGVTIGGWNKASGLGQAEKGTRIDWQ